jgi:hypothetical protein
MKLTRGCTGDDDMTLTLLDLVVHPVQGPQLWVFDFLLPNLSFGPRMFLYRVSTSIVALFLLGRVDVSEYADSWC